MSAWKRTIQSSLLAALMPALFGPVQAQRLVSLDLCSDWLLAHHAKQESIAALSPMAKRQPPPWSDRVWPTHDGSLEHIIALKPDRVIVGAFNATLLRQRLAALRFRVIVLELVTDLDGLARQSQRLLAEIDEVAGHPTEVTTRPRQFVANVNDQKSRRTLPPGSRGRLLLLGPNGYGTGPGTFESSLIHAAGWQNHLQVAGHRPLDLEGLIQNPPDAILWTSPPGPALADRFARHRALARAVPGERWLKTDYWRWQCPGPWSLDLIRQLNLKVPADPRGQLPDLD